MLLAVMAAALAVFWAGRVIGQRESRVYSAQQAPARPVALVLGCSPALANGQENWFFRNRIDCAARLFKDGKAAYLLVSGDNSRHDYDEPTAMRDALIQRGVPADRIYIDYAGFSTLDSIVRASKVLGLDQFTVVSQKDHVMRALYIADARGIQAIGVAAEEVSFRNAARTRLREAIARVRTTLDVSILGRRPKFLGPESISPHRPASLLSGMPGSFSLLPFSLSL